MVFSSIIFIFYFLPTVLVLYYIFRFSTTLKNTVLLLASILFYTWGHAEYVFILISSILVNYFLTLLINALRDKKTATAICMALVYIFNIGILFVYKYLGFLAVALNELFHTNFISVELPLPIGISFFTFKALSYVIDVYRGKAPVQKSLLNLSLYLSIFPQIEAGPVVQYSFIEEQLKSRKETMRMFSVGFCRFITGLAKKVIIANHLAIVADNIYSLNSSMPIEASLAWVGSIAFTLQIYYDISGYSDIAIGLCLMFGFKVSENFNYPYISTTMTEFWSRWHISLMQWFREYVYFPLGGSRLKNHDKVIRNLFVLWLFMGIWHGAEWTFLIWGLLNFAFIAAERLLYIDRMIRFKALRRVYTLFVINILWVIFRSDNLISAGHFMASMIGVNGWYSPHSIMFIKENIIFFILGIIFSAPVAKKMNKIIIDKASVGFVLNKVYVVLMAALFIVCVAYIIKDIQYSFIYFNF